MCNWRAWLLPGLLTLLIVTAAAIIIRGGSIEADLTARSVDSLGMDGTPWASAVLDGRDATLSGTAPTLAARDAAIDAAERVWGVRTVDTSTLDVLPLAEPYQLTFARSADLVTVGGSFPTGEIRAALLDTVRADLGNLALVDESELARGAPLAFETQAGFAIAGLPALESGSITLEDGTLSVDGMTASVEALHAELARLSEPVEGLEIGEISLASPTISPYIWSAAETGGSVRLTGWAPDEETRQALVSAAENTGAVVDEIQLGAGAPDGFADAAIALLSQMAELDNASASINDLSLTLSGEASSSDHYDAANAFLGSLPQGFNSISGRIAPPLADPFVTSLSKAGDMLTLTGVLTSETDRAVLADRIEGEGLSLTDQTTIARGAPEGLVIGDLLASLTGAIADLASAEASLDGTMLSVSGQAATYQGAGDTEIALEALEAAGITVNAEIARGPAAPFTFVAELTDTGIDLTGFVPGDDQRQSILAEFAALFPGLSVNDSLIAAEGAPSGFLDMVGAGLRGLGRLAHGTFTLSDMEAELAGDALFEGSVNQIAESSTAMAPGGFSLSTDIGTLAPPAVVDAAACQAQFGSLLSSNSIRFTTGSADIDALSYGLLDRLVRTLQSCPNAIVQIGGHTDLQGAIVANQRLSEQRATSVLAYVEAAGISSGRLSAVGFGASLPIASNDTEEGRAQNRRIEFTVLPDTQ